MVLPVTDRALSTARGATPQERALILTALNVSPRPSLRSRVRRLLRRP
ncbi:hypothetical protein ACWD25_32315 [Streptomyces sp. NPDC002920]